MVAYRRVSSAGGSLRANSILLSHCRIYAYNSHSLREGRTSFGPNEMRLFKVVQGGQPELAKDTSGLPSLMVVSGMARGHCARSNDESSLWVVQGSTRLRCTCKQPANNVRQRGAATLQARFASRFNHTHSSSRR